MADLAELAAEHGAWFHVDAAYGGFFVLTDRGSRRLRGIELADSVTIDAHKSLFLPYGIGGLIVKRPGALARAHAAEGAYLRDVEDLDALPVYFHRGPENTRPFRGLLPWLPLHLHGVRAFRDVLDRMLDLAVEAADLLRSIPGIDVPRARAVRHTLPRRQRRRDATNPRRAQPVRSLPRVEHHLDEHVTIRLAFLHPRTDRAVLEDLADLVRRTQAQS